MEQVIILGHGALRVSARMFHEEVQNVEKPVSYTHLIHRPKDFVPKMAKEVLPKYFGGISEREVQAAADAAYAAVSYTHLDVYKRQSCGTAENMLYYFA